MVTFIKIVVMNFLCIHACTYMAENSTLSNFGCMHYSLILIYIMCVALKYSICDFLNHLHVLWCTFNSIIMSQSGAGDASATYTGGHAMDTTTSMYI